MRISSTQAQNNFGKYLKFVRANEEIIISKNGKDVAKIISFNDTSSKCIEKALLYETTSNKVSYEEYIGLVEKSDQRYELIDGVIYNISAPLFNHQHIIHEIHGAFYNWFKDKDCIPLTSPFDVTFFKPSDNICVVQPDILVICDKDKLDKKGTYEGVPSLVIEVLSPSTRSKDMIKKLNLYRKSGTNEYWIVDPKNDQIQLYVFHKKDIDKTLFFQLNTHEYVFSNYFKGLKVSLKDIFSY